MAKETIRVLIADDHPVVRHGLISLLSAEPDIEVVAEAADGEEAVHKTRETRPGVVVMDLKMPIKDGLSATREIAHEVPDARTLVLAGVAEVGEVAAALRAGARGFMLKDAEIEHLAEAVRAVYRGTSVFPVSLARSLSDGDELHVLPGSPEPLTPREVDVLRLIARGLSNREIGRELSITEATAMTHVRNILAKLGLANRTQAALYARDHGLATEPNGNGMRRAA